MRPPMRSEENALAAFIADFWLRQGGRYEDTHDAARTEANAIRARLVDLETLDADLRRAMEKA